MGGPPRKLSPIERNHSAGDRASATLPESAAEQQELVVSRFDQIPRPHLDRPVYVRFEERPLGEDVDMYAV